MRIYVGNLPFTIRDEELRGLFDEFGTVDSARVITDRDTGRSKGFGFVEMTDSGAANNAMNELNGREFNGRPLTVNEARPRQPR